jgi:hypothetical protein
VLALGAHALVTAPSPDPGDDIIIKGGSLDIQCGKNHGNDCLGVNDNMGKYKHKQSGKHIMAVAVRLVNSNANTAPLFSSNFNANNQPQIEITYK